MLREVPLYYEFLVLYSSKFLWSKNFSLFCVKSQPQIFLQYRLNGGLIENQGIFRGHNSLELYDTINDKSYLREKSFGFHANVGKICAVFALSVTVLGIDEIIDLRMEMFVQFVLIIQDRHYGYRK